jgi:hypothetical protein
MRRLHLALVGASLAILPAELSAASYYCGNQPTTARTCPDGSIPIFRADELQAAPKPARPDAAGLIGRWRTNVPASVISRESTFDGRRWTEIFPGAAAGDLLIRADGTYAWASYGGKVGRWVRGNPDWPIVLIDTVENRRWQVAFDDRSDGRRIYVWDGNSIYYQGSR